MSIAFGDLLDSFADTGLGGWTCVYCRLLISCCFGLMGLLLWLFCGLLLLILMGCVTGLPVKVTKVLFVDCFRFCVMSLRYVVIGY